MLTFPMSCLACLGAVPDGLAAGALLGAVLAADGADRRCGGGVGGGAGHGLPAEAVAVGAVEAGGSSSYSSSSSAALEAGLDLEVLGGGALEELDQAEGDEEQGEHQLEEPIQIQRESQNMHAMLRLSPRP